MKKLLIVFLASFFLTACSDKNDFMNHSEDTVVFNIVQDTIFGNGEKIGSLSNDVYPRGLIIEPIQKFYQSKKTRSPKVHLRFNTGDSYNTLMKAIWTFAIEQNRPQNIQFVIGQNFNDSIKIEFFQKGEECRVDRPNVLKLLRNEKPDSEEEIQKKKAMNELCDKNYMETELFFSDRKGTIDYTIIVRTLQNQRFYTVEETLAELDKIKNDVSMQEKKDRGKITFISQETTPMGQIADILASLQKKNYHLSFSTGWVGK